MTAEEPNVVPEPTEPDMPDVPDAAVEPDVTVEPDAAVEPPPEDAPKAKRSGRDVAVVAGRTTAGVVVAAVAAGIAFASTLIVPPTWSIAAPAIAVAPTAAPQQLACPGGLLRLATDTGEGASTASPIGAPTTAWTADSELTVRGVGTTNAGTAGTGSLAEIATVAPTVEGVPAAAGLQAEVAAGGIAGLATTSCTGPASEQWLVAGATTLGRTSLLVLTNPSAVEASVDIELYGEDGVVSAAGLRGVRLAPDEQRVMPLNGFAVDLVAPVIRVVSTGGRVTAALQQSIQRSLATGGVDQVGAQQPSSSLVIPGVRVQAPAELAPLDTQPVDRDDIFPILRLFAPGAAEVVATVALIPHGATLEDALAAREDAAAAPGDAHADHEHDAVAEASPRAFELTLTPGLVTEYPIEQVAAGDYTVIVTAAQPLVGAVRTSTLSASQRIDFAWATPAAPLADHAVLALPTIGQARTPGTTATTPGATTPLPEAATAAPGSLAVPSADGAMGYVLWLVNPGTAAASATLTAEGGEPRAVELAPGAATWLAVAPGSRLSLDGVRGLSAALVGLGEGQLAQAPLQPPAQLASEVLVRF